MCCMQNVPRYTVFRILETGEFVRVGIRDDFNQAQQLIASLYKFWPGEYTVQAASTEQVWAQPRRLLN